MRKLMTASIATAAMFVTLAPAPARAQDSGLSRTIVSNVIDIAVCVLVKVCPINGTNQQRAVICNNGSPAPYGGNCSAFQSQPPYQPQQYQQQPVPQAQPQERIDTTSPGYPTAQAPVQPQQ